MAVDEPEKTWNRVQSVVRAPGLQSDRSTSQKLGPEDLVEANSAPLPQQCSWTTFKSCFG